jgi:hypothetical protein
MQRIEDLRWSLPVTPIAVVATIVLALRPSNDGGPIGCKRLATFGAEEVPCKILRAVRAGT